MPKLSFFYFNFQSEELHAAAGGGPKNCVFAQLRINRRTDSGLVCHFNSSLIICYYHSSSKFIY